MVRVLSAAPIPCQRLVTIGNVFICNDCDSTREANFGDHNDTHDLVRCQELVEDVDVSMEARLDTLQDQFATHTLTMDETFGRLESKLDGLEAKVDGRMSRMEALIEAMLAKMGVPAALASPA